MNEGFKEHWHIKANQCHTILPKGGPFSLVNNNGKPLITLGSKSRESTRRAFRSKEDQAIF